MTDNEVKALDRFTELVISLFVGLLIGIFATTYYNNNKNNNTTNIVEKIDSLTKRNDSIKIKIEQLDSIKDAKVIEISTLDNDSTLKLFYKLVSE